jgi:AraC family transcriptional regulator of adaptative response/methylated-DNA-[protein]-cysteine methyltransferase
MTNVHLPPKETMFRAFEERDTRFEGVFVTAVKTTGIFCRPSCRARKPKRENMEFFSSAHDALAHGYRPCRVCHPLEPAGETPQWIRSVLREIERDPGSVVRDFDLRSRGIDPARIRRWFQKHHGMTFHAYARMIRINGAYDEIRAGTRVTDAAFDQGYESLSGFGERFRNTTGFAPSESVARPIIRVRRIATPLGPVLAGATDTGLALLEFTDRRMLERQLSILERRVGARSVSGDHEWIRTIEAQLAEYFSGARREFDLPLDLRGTPFQEAAWRELLTIPYGGTRSYADQARRIGRPTAVRAVGRANGDNRIAIVVPCHRVVGADGSLTGYGGGVWRKRALLDLETRSAVSGAIIGGQSR